MRDQPLDGLRGLAVLMVLASHSSNAGFDVIPGLDARGIGRAGVFLFFVLSSFLLTSQCIGDPKREGLREQGDDGRGRRGPAGGWWRFAARRLLRILPAYALVLGCYVALREFTADVALGHLLLVRAERHFWTIPVEVLFYLSLPILTVALSATSSAARRLGVIVAFAVVARVVSPPDYPATPPDFRPNVLPFLPVFLVGSVLAVVQAALRSAVGARRRLLSTLGWASAVTLFAMSPSVWERIVGAPVAHTRFHLWFDVHGVLFGLVVAATLPRERTTLARVTSWAPLRWLGIISYSVYLFHAIAFGFVHAKAQGVPVSLIGGVSFLAALAAGAASYALVERPFLRVLRGRVSTPLPSSAPS